MLSPLLAPTTMSYLRLSHSSRKLFGGCKRKFEFIKMYPQPEKKEYWDTMIGKALHAGYQNFLVNRDEDQAVWAYMSAVDLRVQSYKEYEKKTLEAGYATLMALLAQNAGLVTTKIAEINVNGLIKPAIEVPFQINLLTNGKPYEVAPGIPAIYVGFMDDVLHDYVTGDYVVEDLKTTRMIIGDPTAHYMFDEQPIPYSLVLNVALGKQLDNLTMRYLHAYVDLVNPTVHPIEFIKTSDLVSDWAKGLLFDLEEIKRLMAAGWWPRNNSYCTSYGNVCNFMDVCVSRDKGYLDEYFGLAKGAKLGGEEIVPWFTIDLELAA